MSKATLKDKIAEIGHDLFNLEINTIIDDNITAVKMPEYRHALIDIAKAYVRALKDRGIDCQLTDAERPGSQASFKKIGSIVHSLLAERYARNARGEHNAAEKDLYLIDRINTKCAQISAMMDSWKERGIPDWNNQVWREGVMAMTPLKLHPKEVMLIRKTWELGTAEIALQTIVQLDGDVVTRINPRFADAGWEGLHQAHLKGLNVALSQWGELVRLLQSFLERGKSLLGWL